MITRFICRSTATLAGLALVLGFVAPVHAMTNQQLEQEIQQLLAEVRSLEAQLDGTSTGAACVFTRDLTIGTSGTDVTCLQTYLIGGGYSIPAGATGYFGTQTQAAVAAWQAAHGVVPAAGYFGAISRATYTSLVSQGNSSNNGNNGGNGNGNGNHANLTSFNLIDRSGNIIDNADGIKLATAQFNVTGGRVNVNRIDLEFQAQNASEDVGPWTYIQALQVYDGNTKIGSVSAGDENDWGTNGGTQNRPVYTITVDVNDSLSGGSVANLDIEANSKNNISNSDNNQSFEMDVPDNGIHATDNANDDLRAGNHRDTTYFEINGGNGGLGVNGTNTSAVLTSEGASSFGTFTIQFNVTAKGDDVYIPDSIGTAQITTAGVTFDPNMANNTTGATINASLSSSADRSGDDYVVRNGDTEQFTAQVVIDPNQAGWYQVGLTQIQFSLRQDGNLNALHLDENNSQYHTNQLYIPNS